MISEMERLILKADTVDSGEGSLTAPSTAPAQSATPSARRGDGQVSEKPLPVIEAVTNNVTIPAPPQTPTRVARRVNSISSMNAQLAGTSSAQTEEVNAPTTPLGTRRHSIKQINDLLLSPKAISSKIIGSRNFDSVRPPQPHEQDSLAGVSLLTEVVADKPVWAAANREFNDSDDDDESPLKSVTPPPVRPMSRQQVQFEAQSEGAYQNGASDHAIAIQPSAQAALRGDDEAPRADSVVVDSIGASISLRSELDDIVETDEAGPPVGEGGSVEAPGVSEPTGPVAVAVAAAEVDTPTSPAVDGEKVLSNVRNMLSLLKAHVAKSASKKSSSLMSNHLQAHASNASPVPRRARSITVLPDTASSQVEITSKPIEPPREERANARAYSPQNSGTSIMETLTIDSSPVDSPSRINAQTAAELFSSPLPSSSSPSGIALRFPSSVSPLVKHNSGIAARAALWDESGSEGSSTATTSISTSTSTKFEMALTLKLKEADNRFLQEEVERKNQMLTMLTEGLKEVSSVAGFGFMNVLA
jgi:hypothetical protein